MNEEHLETKTSVKDETNDLPPPPPPVNRSAPEPEAPEAMSVVSEPVSEQKLEAVSEEAAPEPVSKAVSEPILALEQVQDLIDQTNIAENDSDDDDDDDEEEEDDSDEDEEDDSDDESSEEDIMSTLPREVVRRVEKLKELNDARDRVMEDYLKERAALEQKYLARNKPFYEKRREIVKGNLDDAIDALVVPAEEDAEDEVHVQAKGVPQFWACCMSHLETVAELVTEQDVDCLEHLIDVTCDDSPDGKGFTLKFYFEPNDYFENLVLTKRYEIPNLLLEDEPILKSVTGCDINWKHQRCLTHREIQKKQRSKSGRRAGQIRTVTKREHNDSFFHFFNPPKMPALGEMDEEEADAIEEAFDHDYDVAQSFRSHLVPKAVLWFTGEALEEEVLGMMAAQNNPFFVS